MTEFDEGFLLRNDERRPTIEMLFLYKYLEQLDVLQCLAKYLEWVIHFSFTTWKRCREVSFFPKKDQH